MITGFVSAIIFGILSLTSPSHASTVSVSELHVLKHLGLVRDLQSAAAKGPHHAPYTQLGQASLIQVSHDDVTHKEGDGHSQPEGNSNQQELTKREFLGKKGVARNPAQFVGRDLEDVLTPQTQSRPFYKMWIDGLSFFLIIKVACMMSNMAFQVSPYPLVRKIRLEQDTGETDAAPLVAIAYGCCQWSFYGTFAWYMTGKTGFLVVVYANCLGAVLGVFYVLSYQAHCNKPEAFARLQTYYKAAVGLIMVQATMIALLPCGQALFFIGMASSGCSVMSAVAPLTIVPTVLRTRCSAAIPTELILASSVSGFLWILCGIMLVDPWVVAPNMLAAVANVYLISLILKYPREEPRLLNSRWDVVKGVPQKLRYDLGGKCPNRMKEYQSFKESDSIEETKAMNKQMEASEATLCEKTPLCSTGEAPDCGSGGTF